ncbi:MAG: hypothetical protein L6243_00245 [Candidatus Altiarchaeales archaeon]|nr:hypothetical protein [Candidatus Altiarchaeales archaeon]
MGALDRLKGLFNIDINSPIINVVYKKNSDNTTNSHNEVEYNKSERKLDVILDNISPEKNEKLKPIIGELINEDHKLLEEETADSLRGLIEYNENPGEDTQIKKFFKDILQPLDYEALESALYLRKKFAEGNDVSKAKRDLRERFGDRGGNIANLCTGGYFEDFLKPLYNSSPDKFKQLYESIVGKSIIAIFVHKNMDEDEIAYQLSTKITACKKYGIDFLHIRGIGQSNVQKIKEFIEEHKDEFDFDDKMIYESDDKGIIMVELLLDS